MVIACPYSPSCLQTIYICSLHHITPSFFSLLIFWNHLEDKELINTLIIVLVKMTYIYSLIFLFYKEEV